MPLQRRQIIGLLLAILLVFVSSTPSVRRYLMIPDETRLMVGEPFSLAVPSDGVFGQLLPLTVRSLRAHAPAASGTSMRVIRDRSGYHLISTLPGSYQVSVMAFGQIPLKSITLQSLAPVRLVPGGHSIGVLLHSNGLMVVGMAPLKTSSGEEIFPAQEAGITAGDVILKVNRRPVYTEAELARMIDQIGRMRQRAELLIQRENMRVICRVRPNYCDETGRYRIGLYVRDGVAGVGTLSFWDPGSKQFAALGHIVLESDTRMPVPVRRGVIVPASVESIQPGMPGQPGQKIGIFDQSSTPVGTIAANLPNGVIGVTRARIQNELYPKPIPVAYAHQIQPGSAEILTVVNANQIERFHVMIERVYPMRRSSKGMVIRVTDSRLLTRTGGIIQGMSGSPIIQNGRLIGAVTHVFLNNPARGYGIFMDSMLETMKSQNQEKTSRQIL
ncbi:MAG: SpoIVB peptidase [Solirubrobacterales bacterium]